MCDGLEGHGTLRFGTDEPCETEAIKLRWGQLKEESVNKKGSVIDCIKSVRAGLDSAKLEGEVRGGGEEN